MILTVLLLTVLSTCLAQPGVNNTQQRSVRAPQSQIKYNDPDGSRVDWKLYGTRNQESNNAQRVQRAEIGTGQENYGPRQQAQQETEYKPYSAVPNHIKQLIVNSYAQPGPYVDPGAFLYPTYVNTPIPSPAAPQEKSDQSAYSQTQLEREYFNSAVSYKAPGYQNSEQPIQRQIGRIPNRQGSIKYKDDESSSDRTAQLSYGSVTQAQSQPQYQPYKQIPQYQKYNQQASEPQPQYQQYRQYKQNPEPIIPVSEMTEEINHDKNMPMAIQQLLTYQAMIPYNVIANHILYRPKQPFIPEPLPESEKLAQRYPSKIYYVKNDGEVYEDPDMVKDVERKKRTRKQEKEIERD